MEHARTEKMVIGLVGEKGSGKGEFTNILRGLTPHVRLAHHRSSDVLLQTLRLWNIEPTRENFNKLAPMMEKTYGTGILSKAVRHYIASDPSPLVVYDGIRWASDVEALKSFDYAILLYITADEEIRHQRTKKRGEKVGESNASLEQFRLEEQAETERHIRIIGEEQADFPISNNGTPEELRRKITLFVETKIKPWLDNRR